MYSIVVLPLLEIFIYGVFIRESAHGTNKPRRLLHMKQHNIRTSRSGCLSYFTWPRDSLPRVLMYVYMYLTLIIIMYMVFNFDP